MYRDNCRLGEQLAAVLYLWKYALSAAEEELQVLRGQSLHRAGVIVDCGADHVRFLLLELDHSGFNRVFDDKASDNARAGLTDAVRAISRLPLCGWIPPPGHC